LLLKALYYAGPTTFYKYDIRQLQGILDRTVHEFGNARAQVLQFTSLHASEKPTSPQVVHARTKLDAYGIAVPAAVAFALAHQLT
jgi:hypothetical protein